MKLEQLFTQHGQLNPLLFGPVNQLKRHDHQRQANLEDQHSHPNQQTRPAHLSQQGQQRHGLVNHQSQQDHLDRQSHHGQLDRRNQHGHQCQVNHHVQQNPHVLLESGPAKLRGPHFLHILLVQVDHLNQLHLMMRQRIIKIVNVLIADVQPQIILQL